MQIQSLRGMVDLLPQHMELWQHVEAIIRRVMSSYGYSEIRTPLVEVASLFQRSIGEATDITEKELYLFADRNGIQLALRPEGTAGCVRAGIQHGLFYHKEPRLWYNGPMFRYERPQKGRYRQFWQLGAEVFGLKGPDIDAELILLNVQLWRALGVDGEVRLHLNSLGSPEERAVYCQSLVEYLTPLQHHLDGDSRRRLHSNPLRILDSKNLAVRELLRSAPKLAQFLGRESQEHFAGLCALLDGLGIVYRLDELLVRGLDYYTGTIFEWVTDALGAQNAVCGGGRYDGVVEQLGGSPTPSIGFSIGVERLILLVEEINPQFKTEASVDLYLISTSQDQLGALRLAELLRSQLPNLRLMSNFGGGEFKQQFKRANRVGAKIALVLNEGNPEEEQVTFKFLATGLEKKVARANVVAELRNSLKSESP